jgi:intergrase/recombinase
MNELRDVYLPTNSTEQREVLLRFIGERQGQIKAIEAEIQKMKSLERDAKAYRALVRYRDEQAEHLRDVIHGKTEEEIIAPILEDYEGESDDFVPGELIVGLYKAKLVNRYYFMTRLEGDELRDAEQAEADRCEKDRQDSIEQEAERQRELGEGR